MMGKSLSLQRMPPHVARTQIMSADISWRGRSPGVAFYLWNLKFEVIMSTGLIVTLVVVAVLVIWVISIYNNLVALRNNRENAFANIDVQLKQRYDLIPQLVETVKGYAKHEKELLERITQARSAAMNATSINGKIEADNEIGRAHV